MNLTIINLMACVLLATASAKSYHSYARGPQVSRRGAIERQQAATWRRPAQLGRLRARDITSQAHPSQIAISRRSPTGPDETMDAEDSPEAHNSPHAHGRPEAHNPANAHGFSFATHLTLNQVSGIERDNAKLTAHTGDFFEHPSNGSPPRVRSAMLRKYAEQKARCALSFNNYVHIYHDQHTRSSELDASHAMWRALTRMAVINEAFQHNHPIPPLSAQPSEGGNANEFWEFRGPGTPSSAFLPPA